MAPEGVSRRPKNCNFLIKIKQETHCFFGVNATIRDYSHIKKGTLVAMGASITKQETEEWGVYVGNPAKKLEGKLSYNLY